MGDIILAIIILVIISGSIYKIVKEKRKGTKCIGCPYGQTCTDKYNCSTLDKTSENK